MEAASVVVPAREEADRLERTGYLRLFLVYLAGYLEYALPGRSPAREYFE